MVRRWGMHCLVALACAFAATVHAAEASYPVRPIRLIVPYPPGGSTDPTGRAVGAWLSDHMGQSVVVDNRPGAGSTLGHALGAQAAADGYTLLLGTSGGLVVNPAYGTKVAYDPVKSFTPIGMVVDVPFLLIVHPSVPAKTPKELIALAKAKPATLNFGSPGRGTPNHMGIELLQSLAGIKLIHVPYKGGGPALIDLMSGRIQALFGGIPYSAPAIKAGKARAIAVGHPKRTRFFPDLPALAEMLPEFNNTTWYGILGPAGVPRPIVNKINAELKAALSDAAFRKHLESMGMEPVSSTPEVLGERLKSELARWTKLMRSLGIQAS
jgi:tripartite-type tricarboxylate transporter receptor subunit TctC